jgi:hypothetical protein
MKKLYKNEIITLKSPLYRSLLLQTSKGLLVILMLTGILGLSSREKPSGSDETIIWKLENPALIGGFSSKVLGSPQIVHDQTGTAIAFDGVDDGIIIPNNPVMRWQQFTVEVLFKPAADGPVAPRFVHFEDSTGNRGTIEARITPHGLWYLDTFLKNGKTNKGLTLIDSTHLHPCAQWYWVSLVYDGEKMTHYVNAVKELEGKIELEPMTTGQISLGVRLNKVNWFKGLIKEIRFHPSALQKEALQHF